MNLVFFILRLLALPFMLAFFLVAGTVYIIFLSLAWLVIGETVRIWLTFPDWRP